MAQHSFAIPNSDGATFRTGVNAGLLALATLSAGPTPPSPTYQLQYWFDESNSVLRRRNATNTAWVVVATLSGAELIPYRDGQTFKNALINGGFDVWQSGTSISGITARTYAADMWAIRATGAAIEAQQSAAVPGLSRYSLSLVGASGVTGADVDQRIEAAAIPPIKRAMTFSAYIYNSSGAAFAPTLILSTPAAADNWTTPTARVTAALQSCAVGAWTRVTWTGDIGALTDIDSGLEVRLQMPAGALDLGDTVRLAEIQLEPGRAATPIETLPPGVVLAQCQRHFWRWAEGINKAPFGALQAFTTVNAYGGVLAFPVPMRAVPTASAAGGWVLTTSAAGVVSVTLIQIGYLTRYGAGVSDATASGGGLVAGNATILFTQSDSVLTFDARL